MIAYLVGLIPFTILFVLQRVYYSLEDTRTPFFMQALQSVVFMAGVVGVAFLPVQWIAVGIAVVMTIAGTVQTVVAAALLRGRLGGLPVGPVVRASLAFFGAALVAALVGLAIVWSMGAFVEGGFAIDSRLGGIVTLAVGGAAMAVVYLGLLWIMRNPQLRDLAAPLARRSRNTP